MDVNRLHPDEAVVLRVQGPKEDGPDVARHVVYLPETANGQLMYAEYRIGTVSIAVGRLQTVAVRIRRMSPRVLAEKIADKPSVVTAPVHFLEDHWNKAMASARRRHALRGKLWLFLLPLIAVILHTSATTSNSGRITLTSVEMTWMLIAAGLYAFLVGFMFRYANGHGTVRTNTRWHIP